MVNQIYQMELKKVTITIITFGIGAFDEDAVKTGKSFAKQKKWTTPEKAIMGGAWFVRFHYFKIIN